MNVTEYIASGILESYVMGAASDQERREVECLSSIYPEVRHEMDQLSEAIEQYAMLYSVQPPAFLKDRLLENIDFNRPVEQPGPVAVEVERPEAVIRPMPIDRTESPAYHRTTWIVAASMGLILLCFSVFLLTQLRSERSSLATARNTSDSLKTVASQLRSGQTQSNQAIALLSQPGTKRIELKGNEKAPQGNLSIFWSASTQQVAVDVKSLPLLPTDKQYQLWAMVDGKPVDAGVFEASNGTIALQALNRPVGRADAFAVTVEKRGGSPVPNMSTLLGVAPVKA